MKIVLLILFYLSMSPAWAEDNSDCITNYYEIKGKRTCLLLVGAENDDVITKTTQIQPDQSTEQESVPDNEYDDLQAVDPDVSDPGPD